MNPPLKPIKDWWLNRKWKKTYGTDTPDWAKKDISQIPSILSDPGFAFWYHSLPEDKRKKADQMVGLAIHTADMYCNALEDELIKRGEFEKPETTRD